VYLTIRQQAKLSKYEYDILLELSRYAKDLYNEALYNARQYYFNESGYLNYEKNYHLLKTSENYKMLNSNMAQQIIKEVDGSFNLIALSSCLLYLFELYKKEYRRTTILSLAFTTKSFHLVDS